MSFTIIYYTHVNNIIQLNLRFSFCEICRLFLNSIGRI